MILKFWAFIFRLTGYHSNYAKAKEERYIKNKTPELIKRFNEIDECNLSVEILTDIERGSWQAKHGFTITSKQMKRRMKRRMRKYKNGTS